MFHRLPLCQHRRNTPIFSLYASLSIIGVVERLLLSLFRSGGRKNCRHADF